MEFDNLDSRPGKSWNFGPGHGKSWNLMLANNAVYCSGLAEMYAGKHFKLWQDVNLLCLKVFRVPVAKLYYRPQRIIITCGR